MGSLLVKRFRDQAVKSKDFAMKEAVQTVLYPTGFLNFDFMNGFKIHVKNESQDYYYIMGGVPDGVLVICIGRSGCGKTTFCIQSAANIVKPFPNSSVHHFDIEASTDINRIKSITGFTEDEFDSKYMFHNEGINAESFYVTIKKIYDDKMNHQEDYLYDTGYYDGTGKAIIKMQPTVCILDSVAMLMPGKLTEEEELSGQMSATATAKTNSAVFKRIIPMLKRANIILFCINHITAKVEINPMMHTKGQLSFLKQGEELPGGRAVNYLARLFLRFDDNTKFKETEGYGINGNMVDIQLVKSNTAAAGRTATLVFNPEFGFNKTLSLFNMLKDHKRIGGAGAYLYIDDHSDIKFSQKEFVNKLSQSTELQNYFNIAVTEVLTNLASNISERVEQANAYDPVPGIMSSMNPGLNK